MALVDEPREMILRMFQLQAREGFAESCEVFPDGLPAPDSPLGSDDRIFARFKGRYLFSDRGIVSRKVRGAGHVAWSDILRSYVVYTGGKDVLVVEAVDGAKVRIDLSPSAPRRSALRIEQLVRGLAQRWSPSATTGLAPMSVEAFFAKAKGPGAFAVNLYPSEVPAFFQEAFIALGRQAQVSDILVLPDDPEDEGPVYAEAIAIVSEEPAAFFAPFMTETRASSISPLGENDRRMLGLTPDAIAWLVAWT